jgi:hypothetical protein
MNTLLLKSLITEEVSKILNERPYADEDIVDRNDINIQDEYDKLNQQLFNGILPKVPLLWKDNRKKTHGYVHGTYNRYTGEVTISYLAMSSFHKFTYRQFKNVLAHEMIHIKQMSSGYRGGHGWDFMKEMNRINGMGLGFKITVFAEETAGVSDDVKNGRTLIGMIFNIDGKYYLSVTTPKVFNTEGEYLFDFVERLVNGGKYNSFEITAVETKNPALLSFIIARSLRRGFKYGPLSNDLLEQLLNDNIIKNVKFERGKPKVVSENQIDENAEDQGEWVDFEIS